MVGNFVYPTLSFKYVSRFLKTRMATVRFSLLFLLAASFSTSSAHCPINLWIMPGFYKFLFISRSFLSLTYSQITSNTSCVPSFSKMPAHPNTKKSWYSGSIVKWQTSGCAIITPLFPPYFSFFDSTCPNARDTISLPGSIWYFLSTYFFLSF